MSNVDRPPNKKTVCMVLENDDTEDFALALAHAMDDGWVSMKLAVTSAVGRRTLLGGDRACVTRYHAIMKRWEDAGLPGKKS